MEVLPQPNASVGLRGLESMNGSMGASQMDDGFGYQSVVRPEVEMSEKDRQMIVDLEEPYFNIPYKGKVNVHIDSARRDITAWLHRHKFDVLLGPKAFQRILKEDLTRFGAACYSNAGPEGLLFGAQFALWLYLVDHHIDDCEIGTSTESSLPIFLELNQVLLWYFPEDTGLYKATMSVLAVCLSTDQLVETQKLVDAELNRAKSSPGRGFVREVGPLGSSLNSLLEVSMKTMPKEFCIRWIRSIQLYVIAAFEEARYRENSAVPTIAEYIPKRRDAGGVEPCWWTLDKVYEVTLPDNIYSTNLMQQMNKAICDVISWHNDIWSFKKEMLKGDVYNLVFLISYEQKCSYGEAVTRTMEMVMDRIEDFEKFGTELLAITPPTHQHVVSTYIEGGRDMIAGTEVFHSTSIRFKV